MPHASAPVIEKLYIEQASRMIFNKFMRVFKETKGMPKLFRFQHMLNSITYSLMVLFAFWPWPNGEYSLNGRSLTYQEFWLTGMAPGFLLFSILIIAICFASVNRHWAGRVGTFLYWASIIAFMSFYSLNGGVIGGAIIAVWAYYVFYSTGMRQFFVQSNV